MCKQDAVLLRGRGAKFHLYLDGLDTVEEGIYSGKGKRRREFPRHRLLVLLGERERKGRSMGSSPQLLSPHPLSATRLYLEEKLHVCTTEVVDPVQLL